MQPYVKQYDELGNVLNPVKLHFFDGNNRRNRRSKLQNSSKGNGNGKFMSVRYGNVFDSYIVQNQHERTNMGVNKIIQHKVERKVQGY